MSFLSKIVGGAKKLLGGGGLGGIGDMIRKGIGGLVEKFMPKLDKLLNDSPFSKIANKVLGFLGKIGPQMAQAGGPLGMLGGLLSKIGSMGSLADIAKNLLGKLGGAGALTPPGISNLTEMFAQRQAQLLGGILK
ncbi:MAG: hypothetical protein Q8O67_05045 [Deltaproteobacteria bacterium]|nr:hypothetical protein [Deltaproteobacteria bacterium]